jgi:hypothetical protein
LRDDVLCQQWERMQPTIDTPGAVVEAVRADATGEQIAFRYVSYLTLGRGHLMRAVLQILFAVLLVWFIISWIMGNPIFFHPWRALIVMSLVSGYLFKPAPTTSEK